jgi:hypothetical protein
MRVLEVFKFGFKFKYYLTCWSEWLPSKCSGWHVRIDAVVWNFTQHFHLGSGTGCPTRSGSDRVADRDSDCHGHGVSTVTSASPSPGPTSARCQSRCWPESHMIQVQNIIPSRKRWCCPGRAWRSRSLCPVTIWDPYFPYMPGICLVYTMYSM